MQIKEGRLFATGQAVLRLVIAERE